MVCSHKTRLHSRTRTTPAPASASISIHDTSHVRSSWHIIIMKVRSTQDYLRVLSHRRATPPADISSPKMKGSCTQLQPEVAQAMTNRHALLRPSWLEQNRCANGQAGWCVKRRHFGTYRTPCDSISGARVARDVYILLKVVRTQKCDIFPFWQYFTRNINA